jgi:hypothetical protein
LSSNCARKNRCTDSSGARIDREIVRSADRLFDTRRRATRFAPGDAAPNSFRIRGVDSYAVAVLYKFWHRLFLAVKPKRPAILRLTEWVGLWNEDTY